MVNILVLVNVLTQGMCCAAALDTTGERVVPIKITQRHKKLHQAIHVELNNKFKNQTQETSQNNAPGISLWTLLHGEENQASFIYTYYSS